MRRTMAGLLASLVFCAAPAAGAVEGSAVEVSFGDLIVDGKTAKAQTWVVARNRAAEPVKLRLLLHDFVSTTTLRALGTRAQFVADGPAAAEPGGAPFFERELRGHEVLRLRLQVENLWEAGEATSALLVNDAARSIRAVSVDHPFAVSALLDTAEPPVLVLQRGVRRQLILKNEDGVTYPVRWTLTLRELGATVEGRAVLAPRSATPIELTAPDSWFDSPLEGVFKNVARPGTILLRFDAPLQAAPAPLASRTQQVELRLAHWPKEQRSLWSNLLLLLVLSAGGLTSLLLGLSIPNRLARIDLRRKLHQVLVETRAISAQAPSLLRVALRVERLRLEEQVKALGTFSAETQEELRKAGVDVDAMRKRVAAANRLDDTVRLLTPLKRLTSAAPPSRIDTAERRVRDAAALLAKANVADAELQRADELIQEAAVIANAPIARDEAFGKSLFQQLAELRANYDAYGKTPGLKPLLDRSQAELPDLFGMLGAGGPQSEADVHPGKYHWVDMSVQKLYVLRHYLLRLADARADAARKARIEAAGQHLYPLLRMQDWYSLDIARNLRRQCEQNVFVADVEAELAAQPPRVRVDVDPVSPVANEPARLRIRFTDPRFDECEARRLIHCQWDFPAEVGSEAGWEIVHYFRSSGEAKFRVSFASPSSLGSGGAWSVEHQVGLVQRASSSWWQKDRNRVELGRLFLALFLAMLALLAGAREELLKLDLLPGLVAVFLIGVGADAVKNLFAKKS